MKSAIVLISFAFLLWLGSAFGNIIYIPGDYATIQEGIDASEPGDTIMVSANTYNENLTIDHSLSLFGKHRDNAIIEGGGSADVILIQAGNVDIRNFTIANSGTGSDDAGIKIVSSDSCVVELCRFSGNHIGLSLYNSCYNSITRCLFEANTDGVRFWEDINNPMPVDNYYNKISNNVFSDNTANGIWFDHAMIHHTGNTINGNRITANLIGINMIMSLQNEICGNHIEDNISLGIIHAICEGGGGQNNFYHNNLINNNGDTLQACNWGIGDDIWYDFEYQEGNYWSNYTGPDNDGDGIGDIPMIIDGYNCEDTYPLMNRLHAQITGMVTNLNFVPISDVIVTALGTVIACTTEYHGTYMLPGLDGGNYDVAFIHPQYEDTVVLGVAATPGEMSDLSMMLNPSADIAQSEVLPEAISLLGNYPNPFNANTVIKYRLDSSCEATIEIYDLLGRKIETLLNEYQPAGNHRVTWSAAGQPSGVYFYKVRAGEFSETKRMVLLK